MPIVPPTRKTPLSSKNGFNDDILLLRDTLPFLIMQFISSAKAVCCSNFTNFNRASVISKVLKGPTLLFNLFLQLFEKRIIQAVTCNNFEYDENNSKILSSLAFKNTL